MRALGVVLPPTLTRLTHVEVTSNAPDAQLAGINASRKLRVWYRACCYGGSPARDPLLGRDRYPTQFGGRRTLPPDTPLLARVSVMTIRDALAALHSGSVFVSADRLERLQEFLGWHGAGKVR